MVIAKCYQWLLGRAQRALKPKCLAFTSFSIWPVLIKVTLLAKKIMGAIYVQRHRGPPSIAVVGVFFHVQGKNSCFALIPSTYCATELDAVML